MYTINNSTPADILCDRKMHIKLDSIMLIKLFSKQWTFGWKTVPTTLTTGERKRDFLARNHTKDRGNFIIISQFWTLTFVDLFIVSTASKLRSHWFIPFVRQKFNDIFCLDLWPNVCQCLCQYVLFYPSNKWLEWIEETQQWIMQSQLVRRRRDKEDKSKMD